MKNKKPLEEIVAEMGEQMNMLLAMFTSGGLALNPVPVVAMPLADWLNEWYELYKKPNGKASTLRTYRHYIDYYIIPKLGNIPLHELDGADLQTFLTSIPFANTRFKVGTLLNACLKKAVKCRKLKYNPYEAVEIPTAHSEHYKPLQFAEQNKVLQAIKNELYYNVFWVMCCLGVRIGEFLAIDFTNDIDYYKQVIIIKGATDIKTGKATTTKTENGNRTIRFAEQLIPYLHYLSDYQEKGGKFTYNMVRLYFKRIYTKLKLKGYNLHTFRHTFISLCYYVGIREKYIQKMAGHAKIDITLNIYTHVLEKGVSPLLGYFESLKTLFDPKTPKNNK